jgi:shikimate dehydrogenase
MKNIVLIGMPGSGKTTIGKRLAEQTGMTFVDLDKEIERHAGMSINDIFARYGEPYFRDLETKIATEAASYSNSVLATGGGIILREENMRALSAGGIVVFIDRDPEKIAKKITTDKRPLLKDGVDRIFRLYEECIDLYRNYADCILKRKKKADAIQQLEMIVKTSKKALKLAVIGDPVMHSLSPAIHLPVLKRFAQDATYERVEIKKGDLKQWIDRVKKEGYDGFNVTMPHKQDILPYLDEIDLDAELFHSVNTVVQKDGKLFGHNTDGAGFLQMLTAEGYGLEQKDVVIFGAGGAAGTIAVKLAQQPIASLTILARTTAKADTIVKKIAEINPKLPVSVDKMSEETIRKYCKGKDILVNCTPLGMNGVDGNFSSFDFLEGLHSDGLVCDLIYSPLETELVKTAKTIGLNALGGIGMLLYQALIADEYYIDSSLNLKTMSTIAQTALLGKADIL